MSRKTHELRGVECLEGRDVPSTVTLSAPAPATALITAVALPSSQAMLLSSGVSLKYGEAVTFTAVILPTQSGPNPITGTVTFRDGGAALATVTMTNSQASFTTARLAAGTHTVTAFYNGGNFAPAASAARTLTVAGLSSYTSLIASPATISAGQAATLTATVRSAPAGGASPTGTVTFRDGTRILGTAPLSGGVARLALTSLAAGSHSITAVYGGGGAYTGSTSAAAAVAVRAVATTSHTTTAVTLASGTAAYGQPVTLTATVRPTTAGAATPTGTVTFRDGTLYLGTATLVGGVARLTVNNLVPGLHQITAAYGGSSSSLASADTTPAALTIGRIPAKVNPTLPTATVYAYHTLTLGVTMSSWVPTTLVPQGTITFKDGATVLGTAQLDAHGRATLTLSRGLARGTHTITASYIGSDQFSPHAATEALTVH